MISMIILSFLQICIIPGLIIWLLTNRKPDSVKLLLMPAIVFALSLLVNYVMAVLLASFNIYTKTSLIILIAIEAIIITSILFFLKGNYNFRTAFTGIISDLKETKTGKERIDQIASKGSLLMLVALIIVMISNAGKVFDTWDAIFSWNIWALDFFNNKLPLSTYHYPQLIPANWSVAYVLCGYPFQMVPKFIMHLFLILIIYSFIALGLANKKPALIYSVFFIVLGLNKLYWTDGFADVPVAFFSAMTFACLMMIGEGKDAGFPYKYILISILIACGAALTKQAGIFVAVSCPAMLWIVTRRSIEWNIPKMLKTGLIFIAAFVVLVLSYYLWAEALIKKGMAESEIPWVTNGIYEGASLSARFKHACILFTKVFNVRTISLIGIILFVLSFRNATIRLLNIFFVIPYFIIWSLFFSYDLRNAAVLIPVFSVSIGYGIDLMLNYADSTKKIDRYILTDYTGKIIRVVIAAVFIAGILMADRKVTSEQLIESQNSQIKLFGKKEVNNLLYQYNEKYGIEKSIVSDYVFLGIMPGFEKKFIYDDLENLQPSSPVINQEKTGFLLWTPDDSSRKFPGFIEEGINSGVYKEIFNSDGNRLIKIR